MRTSELQVATGWGVLAVGLHLLANVVHGWAHLSLGVAPPPGTEAFIVLVIFAAPVVGIAIAARWPRVAAWTLGTSMAASLAFGVAWHFVIDSVDRCDHVGTASLAARAFAVSAIGLGISEGLGIAAAIGIARGARVERALVEEPRAVILVDGTCVFCTRLVKLLLAHDREGYFRFAHIQGELGRAVLARAGIDPPDLDGVYLVLDPGGPRERLLVDGEAGRRIYPRLMAPLGTIVHVVPLPVLNLGYRAFARMRYRLFGQAQQCIVPTAEEKLRFIG